MDIPRPFEAQKRRRKRIAIVTGSLVVLGLVTLGLSRLEPAAPSVEKSAVWTDTVKRGPMLRQVRGNGTLVPKQIQYVQADSDGRVERILILPGAEVKADTVILELSNPELKQAAFDAEWALKGAEAQLIRLRVQLESERLSQQATLATLKSDLSQAVLDAEADEILAKDGLVPALTMKRSRAKANELQGRFELEKKRLEISADSVTAQLAVQEAEVEKYRASLGLKQRQVEALHVKAGIDGVLQQIGDTQMLQVGQRVSPSATLAKVVRPSELKAEIKVIETQAKDIQLGQVATVDTRNGIIPGHVIRIDPAVQNGTVLVEVELDGPLPKGARPDLSVDGTIELERLNEVIFVGRMYQGQSDGSISIFKLVKEGREAIRVPVKLGRSSVSTIEVVEGLQPGEQIILSDMSQWDTHERIRLN